MTKQTTQELELIISDAPESFNYIDSRGFYHNNNARSLDDIRENLELRKEVERLEKENLKTLGWISLAMMRGLNNIDCSDELLKIIAIRDLEQQAKALEDAHKHIVKEEMFRCARDYIREKAVELRDEIKEQ